MDEVSDKQLEANKQNAKLGGVKTDQGKAISRFNALKHGLLSREVLLRGEDEENLVELGKNLREVLKPASELELLFVDRIIANVWRLRRALKAEKEIIDDELKKTDLYSKTPHTLRDAFIENLNNDDIFGKFIRYENSIERGLYKALHELQRIQATRKGDKQPLPVAVDVDISKEK